MSLIKKFLDKLKKYITRLSVLLSTTIILVILVVYGLLYTALPVYLTTTYIKFSQNIAINTINTEGYLLSNNGLNIKSLVITKNTNQIILDKINIKLSLNKIFNYKLDFKITKIALHNLSEEQNNYINNDIIHVDNISGHVSYNTYYIYLDKKPIIWRDNTKSNSYKNHISLEIKKSLRILDILPRFNKFIITADFNHNRINWNIVSFLSNTNEINEQNHIIINGHTKLANYIPQESKLKLTTANPILLADTREAKLYGTPEISLKLSKDFDTLDIDGQIVVDHGLITPIVTTSVKPSDDVEFINTNNKNNKNYSKPKSEPLPFNINTNIKLIAGNKKLLFKTKDLQTKLTGNLNLHYHHGNDKSTIAPLAQGEINLIDGVYQLYGYPLKIKQGTLLYANSPINNPNIKLVGERTVKISPSNKNNINKLDKDSKNNSLPDASLTETKTAKVTINISGSLNNPSIKLSSSVLLSESDRISYLLFGVPSYRLNEAHGQILLQTAKELFGGDNKEYTKISTQVKNVLKIDEINLENKSVYNPETGHYEKQPTIIIGKKFFNQLLLRYGYSVTSSLSTVSAEYKLRKNLSLTAQIDSQNNSSADIIYSKETDRII